MYYLSIQHSTRCAFKRFLTSVYSCVQHQRILVFVPLIQSKVNLEPLSMWIDYWTFPTWARIHMYNLRHGFWEYDILLLVTIGTLKFLSVTMNTIDMPLETLFCPDCNVASRMRTFQDWSFFVSFHVLCNNYPIIDIHIRLFHVIIY